MLDIASYELEFPNAGIQLKTKEINSAVQMSEGSDVLELGRAVLTTDGAVESATGSFAGRDADLTRICQMAELISDRVFAHEPIHDVTASFDDSSYFALVGNGKQIVAVHYRDKNPVP